MKTQYRTEIDLENECFNSILFLRDDGMYVKYWDSDEEEAVSELYIHLDEDILVASKYDGCPGGRGLYILMSISVICDLRTNKTISKTLEFVKNKNQ